MKKKKLKKQVRELRALLTKLTGEDYLIIKKTNLITIDTSESNSNKGEGEGVKRG